MTGYVRVPPQDDGATDGLDWREPVDTREELRQLDNPDGTVRLVFQGNHGYVKEGSSWLPFTMAGDTASAPPPVHLSAVDRLAELAREPAHPE